MQENYALGIVRTKKEPYCFPMALKDIDKLTTSNSKEEILNIMKYNDPMIIEKDTENVRIFQKQKSRWKEANLIYIDSEHSYLLTYSLEKLFQNENQTKILNILYNHFSNYLQKRYVSENMKETIRFMKQGCDSFLSSFYSLGYIEQRLIRTYLASKVDVSKYKEETKEEMTEVPLKQVPIVSTEEYKLEMKKAS